jgi:hypothetical protein
MKRLALLAVLFLGLNATSSGLEIRGSFKVVSVAFDFDASSKFKKPFRKSFLGNVYRFLDHDKLHVTYSRRVESHGGYAVICGVLECMLACAWHVRNPHSYRGVRDQEPFFYWACVDPRYWT